MFLVIALEVTIQPMDTATSKTHATVNTGSLTNSSMRPWASNVAPASIMVQPYRPGWQDGCMYIGLTTKTSRLQRILEGLGTVVVAYSGGVDSATLAAVAHQVLGPGSLAVTAVSPSLARSELAAASGLARRFGWAHAIVRTHEGDREEYARNDADRCYWCKTELFEVLAPLASERGARIAVGTNVDDLGDYRPGLRAASERHVATPLVDSGLTKPEVRMLAAKLGLPAAEKPASPCLASRFAYGVRVTPDGLQRVDRAEEAVRALGFTVFRVRDHGDLARIEVPPDEIERAASLHEEISAALRELGFRYVALDLSGFRSGAMNEVLPSPRLRDGGG